MSNPVLSLALRPKSLDELIGQDSIVSALKTQMATRPAKALMFTGESGCGKTTLARIVALSCQCTHGDWGTPCSQCRKDYRQFAIHEINASEVNGVAEIRRVAERSRMVPLPPSKRNVLILDEAQLLTNASQNLLLKPTEDAPEHTLWIIGTTEPTKLKAALKRRFLSYTLKPLGSADRKTLLMRAGKAASISKTALQVLSTELDRYEIRSPGVILMALDKVASGIQPAQAVTGASAELDTLTLCRAVTKADWKTAANELKDMDPSQARFARACLAGWLKACLLKDGETIKSARFADAIHMLTEPAPLEDSLLYAWLIQATYRACKRMRT